MSSRQGVGPCQPADAFRLRDADRFGLTREQVRSARWQRLSQGLYAPRVLERSPLDLARAHAAVLPRDSGLGPVECQAELWERGLFVARADLHLVGTSRYPECDGGEHRDRERHGRDLSRDRRMTRGGYERYGYTTEDIARRADLVIRDAEEARHLSHDERRVRTWQRYARTSTLTPYGRARLAARLERYRLAAERHRSSRVAPIGGATGPADNQKPPRAAGGAG